MVKFDYLGLRATAVKLIDRFGRDAARKVVTNTGTSYNPTQTIVSVPFIGAFIKYKTNEIDGTLVKASDKKVLTYDEIILSDIISDSGIEYNVMNVEPINPGDTTIIYKVQIRK